MTERILAGASNTRQTRFGALISSTTNVLRYEDDYTSALGNVLADFESYPGATARITSPDKDGRARVEVQVSEESFALEEMKWEITPSSLQERTTVDVNGDPIVLSYADSLDWADELTGTEFVAFQYTTYSDQVGEADVYITSQEITGTKQFIVSNGAFIDTCVFLLEWQNTINETEFFGHAKGNVLCLGWTLRILGRRPNYDMLVEAVVRFITRPGSPISQWGAGAGGWNSFQYWKDPNSGMVPSDVHTVEGALKEVQHYPLKDFTVFYETET